MVHRSFDPGMHPHAPAGSPTGGEFTPTKGSKKSGQGGGHTTGHSGHGGSGHAAPVGKLTTTLAYDPKHNLGPGYGNKNGDPHVHELQRALNRLGLTDAGGKRLVDDGKLGPRTTAAIKRAQKALGLKADGKVTPEFYARLLATKTLPKAHHRAAGGDMHQGAGPGPMMPDAGDMDPAMEQHLEDLLGGLSDDELQELAALAEAMHADGGM